MKNTNIFKAKKASNSQVLKIAGRNVTLLFSGEADAKAIKNAKEILSKSYINSLLSENRHA